jgi:IS30 family transposase
MVSTGINENKNGLIRQYFPKGTDFNTVTDKHVMDRLNNQPRREAVSGQTSYLKSCKSIYLQHN